MNSGTLSQTSPYNGLYLSNGALFDLGGFSLTLASLSDDGYNAPGGNGFGYNNLYNSTSTLSTLSIAGNGGVFSGIIGGNGNFPDNIALQILGSQTLAGANTYAGGTTIQGGGLLNINADTALGSTSSTLTFANGTLQAGNGGITLNSARTISISSGATGTIDTQAYNMQIDSTIGGPGVLAKIGAGTLTLTASNSHGGTQINSGILNITAGAALAPALPR